jgi:hypothetical protein
MCCHGESHYIMDVNDMSFDNKTKINGCADNIYEQKMIYTYIKNLNEHLKNESFY